MRQPARSESRARHEETEYWRVTRTARYLDVSTKRIYTMIADGLLPAIRVGERSIRIPRAAIDDFLATAQPVCPAYLEEPE